MKLSCITTTFNDGPALRDCVRAVLGQGFGDFEYLIVDDGSTDDTPAILAEFDDPRIRVIRQANDGLAGARNKALKQVRGDYVCFLDADDSRPAWAFGAIAETIDRDAPDVILCRGVLSDLRGGLGPFHDDAAFALIESLCPEGTASRDTPAAAWLWPLAQLLEPQSANKVVRTALLRETGIGFPDTHFFEDIYFHTGVLAAARRLSFVHDPCFAYFRGYRRPQITGSPGAQRFDILAVTRLTLEAFARQVPFHDPLYRAAVLASCLRLVQWCEESVGHPHRWHFRIGARAVLRTVDPLYAAFPQPLPPELPEMARAQAYLAGLREAA